MKPKRQKKFSDWSACWKQHKIDLRRTLLPRFFSWGANQKSIYMTLILTAIYQKAIEGGYMGLVAELPGAITQGETLEETRENLQEAIALVLEGNRILAEEALPGQDVIREPLIFL